jgi:hypothetical protein
MTQTAVEWLADELYEKFEMRGDGILFDEILNKAKEIEKQQIIDAYEDGYSDSDNTFELNKEYYKEKFKNK